MSFWSDPVGSISGSVSGLGDSLGSFFSAPAATISQTYTHASDVLASDNLAKAAAVAAAVYFTGGLGLAGEGATAASGASELVPITSSSIEGWGTVAHVVADGGATSGSFLSGLTAAGNAAGSAAKILGSMNAISNIGARNGPVYLPVSGSQRGDYRGSGGVGAQGSGSQGQKSDAVTTGNRNADSSTPKQKDSTLTILASCLTIAAILYQFSR